MFLSDRFPRLTTSAFGREYPVANGRFEETEFDWLLSGYEFEARTIASRPDANVAVSR